MHDESVLFMLLDDSRFSGHEMRLKMGIVDQLGFDWKVPSQCYISLEGQDHISVHATSF